MGLAIGPTEYDAPLLVGADAMEAGEFAAECLESIAGWRAEIQEQICSIDHVELAQRGRSHVGRECPGATALYTVVQICRGLVAERGNHEYIA